MKFENGKRKNINAESENIMNQEILKSLFSNFISTTTLSKNKNKNAERPKFNLERILQVEQKNIYYPRQFENNNN